MASVSEYTGYQNAAQRMKESYESERAESDENHTKQVQKIKEDAEKELEASRKEIKQRLTEERQAAREEVKQLKEDLYDNTGKKAAQDAKEKSAERKAFNNYRETVQKEADKKVEHVEQYADSKVNHANERTANKVEDAVSAQKRSTAQQVSELQQELSAYRSEGRDTMAARDQARADAVAEFEKSNFDERNRIIETYERTINRMKQNEEENQDRFNQKATDIVFQANAKARDQLKNQKSEFNDIARNKDLQAQYQDMTLKNQLKNEKFQNQLGTTHLIDKHEKDTQALAQLKDQTYGDYLRQKNEKMNYDYAQKDAKITELSTTADPLKASPNVVAHIHDMEERRFTAEMKEQEAAHQRNLQAARNRDIEDRRTLSKDYAQKYTQNNRERQHLADTQSRQFLTAYDELKNLGSTQLASANDRARQSNERLHMQNALTLAETQQRNQEALEEQRTGLLSEKNEAIDDADHAQKLKDREWFIKTNDLRRSYEQKLADEKDLHDLSMSELRLEYDKKLRDMDRNSKRNLESRVKAYEHQIQQLQVSSKERERFLTEHYEQELATMKRTNAHLIAKKS